MICPHCEADVDLSAHAPEVCRATSWAIICPPLYRKTEVDRLDTYMYPKAMAWQYGSRGLLLNGPTGVGKSRIAWEVLKREHMAGRRISTFDCMNFSHECARLFNCGEGEDWIEKLARRELVFFDDIDKPKFTERVESELFGLVEKRIANCLPIIATTQLRGREFAARFGDAVRGQAIVRRLREFCDVVNFMPND